MERSMDNGEEKDSVAMCHRTKGEGAYIHGDQLNGKMGAGVCYVCIVMSLLCDICEEIIHILKIREPTKVHSENLDMHLKNANGLSNLRPQGWLYIHNGHRGRCTIKNVSKKLLMATQADGCRYEMAVGWL